MSIDKLVPLVEAMVLPPLESLCGQLSDFQTSTFSHRHAVEAHALGMTCEFAEPKTEYRRVLIGIYLLTMHRPEIAVAVMWVRSSHDFGLSVIPRKEYPLSLDGISMLQRDWPKIQNSFVRAIHLGRPVRGFERVIESLRFKFWPYETKPA